MLLLHSPPLAIPMSLMARNAQSLPLETLPMLLSEKRSIESPLSLSFIKESTTFKLPLVSTKSPRGLPASTGLYITTFQTRQTNHTSKRLERFRLRLHHPPFILRLSSHQLRARSHELSLSLSLSTRAWLDQCKPSHSQRFTSLFKSTPLTLSYSFVFLFFSVPKTQNPQTVNITTDS